MHRRSLLAAALALAAPPTLARTQSDEVTVERLQFESRGKPIRAAAFRPGANANGCGVVFIHGSGGIGPRQLAFARRFADDGYLTLVPTYLDEAADDGVRRRPIMDAWRTCGIDAVEWLIAQGVAPQRTAILGYSLGSHIAVDGALGGGRAATAVAIAGGWDVYPPRVPRRRIPVLMIRNELDTHVTPQGTARLVNYLIDHDIPLRQRVNRGAPHIMSTAQWNQVYDDASAYLADTLRHD